MKVLYLATSGASDPTKASIPLHIAANGPVEAGRTARSSWQATRRSSSRGRPPNAWRASTFPLRASSWRSCSTTRSRSTSERDAPSPVGRPTKT